MMIARLTPLLTVLICAFSLSKVSAQYDTLILSNDDMIVGEVKKMDRGTLEIETPYSDTDFKIEWEGIKTIKAQQYYLISLSTGERFTGRFSSSGDKKIVIHSEEGQSTTVNQEEVVYINSIDKGFSSRLSANVDFGYSFTKANNQQQINSNFRIGYLADLWSLSTYYNSIITTQDNSDNIQRNDGGLGYRYFLPKDWYWSTDLTLLSNTEQSLKLRTTAQVGIGKYIIHTNTTYWGFKVGGAYNFETFSPVSVSGSDSTFTNPDRNSFEGVLGTEVSFYDIGDLNLFSNVIVYPTLVAADNVDSGRIRVDFRFDAKYSNIFIDDLYIRAGFILNYDNRAVEVGKEVDYIFTTGFGWQW